MNCIFCKILNNEISSRKVYEDSDFIAILDAFPANEGHTLVIPKKHFENIFEIDSETISKAYKIAQIIANKIKDKMGIKNINILQNNGAIAGQSVNHFHIHIIPRKENDTITIKSEVVEISQNRLDEIKDILLD